MGPQNRFFKRLKNAFQYSFHGYRVAFTEEAAFRQIILLLIVLSVVASILPLSMIERVLLIIPLGISVIVELLNSAIENVVDLVSPNLHPFAKKAKDMGSAAQLTALILLGVVWIMVLWSHFA